jgi:hypothetical protein
MWALPTRSDSGRAPTQKPRWHTWECRCRHSRPLSFTNSKCLPLIVISHWTCTLPLVMSASDMSMMELCFYQALATKRKSLTQPSSIPISAAIRSRVITIKLVTSPAVPSSQSSSERWALPFPTTWLSFNCLSRQHAHIDSFGEADHDGSKEGLLIDSFGWSKFFDI